MAVRQLGRSSDRRAVGEEKVGQVGTVVAEVVMAGTAGGR